MVNRTQFRSTTAAMPETRPPVLPKSVKQAATALRLGAFKDAEFAMGGRGIFTFEKGAVYEIDGVVDRVQVGNAELPAGVVNAASEKKLGRFVSLGESWGTTKYVFEKGSVSVDGKGDLRTTP